MKDRRAIVVGAGALGCPAATYVVAAGVGTVGIADGDVVTAPGGLHYGPDVGANKAESAAAKLRLMNPGVVVEPYPVDVESPNAEAIVMGADLVVDCTGAGVVNDACCAQGVPFVAARVGAAEGYLLTVVPGRSACWRCAGLGDEPGGGDAPPALAGAIGALAALAGIKLLEGSGDALLDRVVLLEAGTLAQSVAPANRLSDCSACAEGLGSPSS